MHCDTEAMHNYCSKSMSLLSMRRSINVTETLKNIMEWGGHKIIMVHTYTRDTKVYIQTAIYFCGEATFLQPAGNKYSIIIQQG